jgi:8-oxo-dGTP diphosphatase
MSAAEQGADATVGRWLVMPRTLSFVRNADDVLLMKRGPHRRVFPNRFNGLGGHVERGEDVLAGARREIFEESGLRIAELQLCAVANVDAGSPSGILLFVFTGFSDTREVKATNEGTLHWIPIARIGELDLVEDLPLLLPRVLALGPHEAPLFLHTSYDADDRLVMRFGETF